MLASHWHQFGKILSSIWSSFGAQKSRKNFQIRYQKLIDFWDPTFDGFWWILVGRTIQNRAKSMRFTWWSWSSQFSYKSDLGIKNCSILDLKSGPNPSSGPQSYSKIDKKSRSKKRGSKVGKSEAKSRMAIIESRLFGPLAGAPWGKHISKTRQSKIQARSLTPPMGWRPSEFWTLGIRTSNSGWPGNNKCGK